MKTIIMKTIAHHLIASAALIACAAASAQTIDRVKLSDNDLTCQQIFNEIGMMDTIIASQANQPAQAAPAPAAPQPGVAQGVAGAVAQQAIGQAAARSGGLGGLFGGGGGGGLGGMFGNIVGQAMQGAAQQPQAAAPAPAPAPAQNTQLIAQAQGRKEHLTGLFLGKSCKMSEMQR